MVFWGVMPADGSNTDQLSVWQRAQLTSNRSCPCETWARRFAQSWAHLSAVSAESTAVWAALRSTAEVLELAVKVARVFCALVRLSCAVCNCAVGSCAQPTISFFALPFRLS